MGRGGRHAAGLRPAVGFGYGVEDGEEEWLLVVARLVALSASVVVMMVVAVAVLVAFLLLAFAECVAMGDSRTVVVRGCRNAGVGPGCMSSLRLVLPS